MSNSKRKMKPWAVLFYMALWQIIALCLDSVILLPGPVTVLKVLLGLVTESFFWSSILYSTSRILMGFFLAGVISSLMAVLSHRFTVVKDLAEPVMQFCKSTPVASFIILALVWLNSSNLSVFISFIMVLPIMYTNVLDGIESIDRELVEMASLFRVPISRRFRYIYLTQILPFFRAACSVSIGMCFKSGIAAEVIGMPRGSIGDRLYQAKILLETPELFAWTVVIIAVSVLFERLILFLIDLFVRRMETR